MAAALGGELGDALPPEGKTAPLGDDGGTGGRDKCRRQRVGQNLLRAISLFNLLDGNNLFPSRSDMDAPDYLLKLNNRITNIHVMNLRSLDLNLLIVFECLISIWLLFESYCLVWFECSINMWIYLNIIV